MNIRLLRSPSVYGSIALEVKCPFVDFHRPRTTLCPDMIILATLQIPYLLTLAGQVCSYLEAFPFSVSFFPLAGKIDQGFALLLQAANHDHPGGSPPYHVSMTDKVRIKSLVEETRVAAVNAASASGYAASTADISEIDSDEEDDDDDEANIDSDDIAVREDEQLSASTIPLKLSRVYKQTLEILGDSLASGTLPQHPTSTVEAP